MTPGYRLYAQRLEIPSERVQGAGDASTAPVENVRVDHGGRYIGMAEQFLHGADIAARHQQMSGEAVAQGVAIRRLGQPGCGCRLLDRLLQAFFVQVKPPNRPASGAGNC